MCVFHKMFESSLKKKHWDYVCSILGNPGLQRGGRREGKWDQEKRGKGWGGELFPFLPLLPPFPHFIAPSSIPVYLPVFCNGITKLKSESLLTYVTSKCSYRCKVHVQEKIIHLSFAKACIPSLLTYRLISSSSIGSECCLEFVICFQPMVWTTRCDIHRVSRQIHDKWIRFTCCSCTL